jgi:hypothetical protein
VRHVTALGYEIIIGYGEYKLHNEKRLWHEARDICAKEGAHLVIINSEREVGALTEMWEEQRDVTFAWLHVGFYRQNEKEGFVTVLGKFPFLYPLCVQYAK